MHSSTAGVNVRQRHHHDHVELIFDVMLKWAGNRQHAIVSIAAAGNIQWAAQQSVAAPAELHHVQVSCLPPHLQQMHDFLQGVTAGSLSIYVIASAFGLAHHEDVLEFQDDCHDVCIFHCLLLVRA